MVAVVKFSFSTIIFHCSYLEGGKIPDTPRNREKNLAGGGGGRGVDNAFTKHQQREQSVQSTKKNKFSPKR